MIKLITTDKQGYLREENIRFESEKFTGLPLVRINSERKYQEFLGFGIALTDASCYLVDKLAPEVKEKLLKDIFSADGLDLSVARLSVGASDYACECYNYDNTPDDFELKDFNIDYDRRYIIPVVKRVKEINPDMFLFSSTWSAPGWMKTGGSMCGGWLRHKYLKAYAKYYVKYLLEYSKEGIRIDALTAQNESETDQVSRMPATYLHPEFEMELAKDYFHPMLMENGLDTKIWISDHNFIHWNRVKWMLDDEEMKRVTTGAAFHYYEGTAEMLSLLHKAHPSVEIHWTEGGPDLGPNYGNDWCKWGHVFTDALNHWCKSITGWNLILDENGKPSLGPFNCAGLFTVDSKTQELSYSGQYRAFGHFSKYIKRGARRIHSEGAVNGLYNHSGRVECLHHIAFENAGGELVIVLTNPLKKQEIQLEINGKNLRVALSEDSITTVIIND